MKSERFHIAIAGWRMKDTPFSFSLVIVSEVMGR
jgi:hypothetical protein